MEGVGRQPTIWPISPLQNAWKWRIFHGDEEGGNFPLSLNESANVFCHKRLVFRNTLVPSTLPPTDLYPHPSHLCQIYTPVGDFHTLMSFMQHMLHSHTILIQTHHPHAAWPLLLQICLLVISMVSASHEITFNHHPLTPTTSPSTPLHPHPPHIFTYTPTSSHHHPSTPLTYMLTPTP